MEAMRASHFKKISNLIPKIDLKNIKSTLIVTYCGRSGSYLFSNLMDSHPEVLSCPPGSMNKSLERITAMFQNYMKNPASFTTENFIEQLILDHPKLFKESDRSRVQWLLQGDATAPEKLEGVPKELFRSVAKFLLESHIKKYDGSLEISDVFSLIHWGYTLATDRQMSTNAPVICWQRHTIVLQSDTADYEKKLINPIFITAIRRFEDSLDSHLLHMKDDPQIASVENLLDANGKITSATKQTLCDILVSQFIANLIRKPIQVPHYAIKFEDMHINTDKIMKKVCNMLDINFDPILLETTLDGELYYFRSLSGQNITGVNKSLKKKITHDILNESDVLLLNLILRRYYLHYDYEFNNVFLNELGFDPCSEITESTIMHLIAQTNRFKDSYLLEPMLTKTSPIYLPDIIPKLRYFNQIDLIN